VSINDNSRGQNKEKAVHPHGEYVGEQSIRDAVMESVSRLPQQQREAIILHYYEELSVGEIANVMCVPHQDVLKYLAQAKKRLAAELKDKPHDGSISAIAPLTIGSILSDSLRAGTAELFPSNVVDFTQMVSQRQGQILPAASAASASTITNSIAKASRSRIHFGLAVSACTALLIAGALALGVLLGGTMRQSAYDSIAAHHAAIEARVVYTGGEADGVAERINPVQADLLSGNSESSLNVIQWWITAPGRGGDVILYEDRDGNLNIAEALSILKESGQYGEYNLNLRFSDDHGDIYRLSSNFFIYDEQVPLAANP